MNHINGAVMDRLAPTIVSYMHSVGLDPAVTPSALELFINPDGSSVLHVTVTDLDGVHVLMRLDPARHGLALVGDELMVVT